ncbi:hypothetical protein D3C76_1529480 [compost metagenome]
MPLVLMKLWANVCAASTSRRDRSWICSKFIAVLVILLFVWVELDEIGLVEFGYSGHQFIQMGQRVTACPT